MAAAAEELPGHEKPKHHQCKCGQADYSQTVQHDAVIYRRVDFEGAVLSPRDDPFSLTDPFLIQSNLVGPHTVGGQLAPYLLLLAQHITRQPLLKLRQFI